MGVRLLYTFITKCMKNGYKDVDIKDDVEEYKRKNNGAEPLIVIDLLTISHLFYTNAHEVVLGGRYALYTDRVRYLMCRLKSLGLKLAFFVDGVGNTEKLPTILKRRNSCYETAIQVLNFIYSDNDLSLSDEMLDSFLIPNPFASMDILREYGEVFTCNKNECDLQLAEYATRHQALAIISNDTDFLIYEGDWKFYSANYFDMETLTTIELDRQRLREELRLTNDEMPFLATMAGNDYVPYDLVQDFHRKIKRNQPLPFHAIAREIKWLRLSMQTITEGRIKGIAERIFDKPHQISGIDMVKNSLGLYDYTKIKTHDDDVGSSQPVGLNLIILANIKHILQIQYFDLSKNDFMPFFDITAPLIERIMGVLLKYDTTGSTARTFYAKRYHEREYEEVILEPCYPTSDVPPLENLLYDKVERGSTLDNTRMQLFSWIINSPDSASGLSKLPAENIVNVAALLYLIQLKQITTDEADCLLLACNCPSDLRYSLKLDDIQRVNERDARIAFLFHGLYDYVEFCFDAVGLSDLYAFETFDGLHFHTLRKQWSTIDRQQLLQPYTNLRIYAE